MELRSSKVLLLGKDNISTSVRSVLDCEAFLIRLLSHFNHWLKQLKVYKW